MKPIRARTPWAVVAAAGLALTGCAEATAPPDAPGTSTVEPAPATLDWTASVCSALGPAYQALGAPPGLDLTDPAATRDAYLGYLQEAANAVDQALARVRDAGAPPVDGGEALAEDLRAQLTDLRDDLTAARDRLTGAGPQDLAAVGDALRAAGETAAAIGNGAQVRGVFAQEPEVVEAVDRTPECAGLPFADPAGGG